MAVHGIDLASSAPLGDLLPGQFFVKFQIFVEIIRVDHGLIMFRQDRLVVGDGSRKFFCFYLLQINRDLFRRADRPENVLFLGGDIAAIVGIRKIRTKGVVVLCRFAAKALRTNRFDFTHSKISIDHEHSCLILCHIAPLSSKWNSPHKTDFPAHFHPSLLYHKASYGFKGVFSQSLRRALCAK